MLTFGWLTQLIFGVALWMFPKYTSAKPRGHEWLGWTTFIFLNTGLILRVIFEPFNSISPSPLGGWMIVLAAILQWLAGIAFVANTWVRVREK
jgi:heme/copper-type cytochrome/quinol oxidase subunit 1